MSFLDAILPDWTWMHRDRVQWLWAVLALIAVLAVLEWRGRDALGRFLSPVMQRRLVTRPSIERTAGRLLLLTISLFAMVLALMRPRSSGGDTENIPGGARTTGDVVIVLDVSKSMLAEDVAPNRLTRARVEISEMVKQLPGQRVGLVAFAGRAAIVCPLTPDQAYFNLALRGVDTRTVSRGGTRIGEAVRKALEAFPDGGGAKLIVLITDGEDHESNPLDAAKLAKAAGVRIVAVGLGSEEGSPITITDPKTGAHTQMLHDGQPVISRLDGATLRQMALETNGAYVPAGTSALDLESIVNQNITPILTAEADKAQQPVKSEEFPSMVALALVALIGALAVGAYSGRSR
jgi:Ca-activated chloride channel family protein